MSMRPLILITLLLCVGLSLQGQSPTHTVRLIPGKQAQDLTPSITLLVDSTARVTIDNLLHGEYNTSFTPLTEYNQSIVKHFQYWLRIPFAPNAEIQNWWLVIKTSDSQYTYYPQWDDVHGYVTSGKEILHQSRTGVETPRSLKEVKLDAGANVLPISLDALDSLVVYIHLDASLTGPAEGKILVELRDPSLGFPVSDFSPLLIGLSVAAFMIGLLSLFFFLFVREKAYLFFFFYVLFLGLHYLILHPTIPFINWFIPETPGIVHMCFMFLAVGSFIQFLLFGRYFINLGVYRQRPINGLCFSWQPGPVYCLPRLC
jgi:hypothetical protein